MPYVAKRWSAEYLNWPIVTRAHAPRQVDLLRVSATPVTRADAFHEIYAAPLNPDGGTGPGRHGRFD